MIAYDSTLTPIGDKKWCPFAGRRDGKNFVLNHVAVMAKYGDKIKMAERIPEALSGAMANQMYVATFDTEEEMNRFYKDVLAVRD